MNRGPGKGVLGEEKRKDKGERRGKMITWRQHILSKQRRGEAVNRCSDAINRCWVDASWVRRPGWAVELQGGDRSVETLPK
jgi:hypothetical protein